MKLCLSPNEWVRIPASRVEVNAECGGVVQCNRDGWWDLSAVPGRVVARIVLPGGRRSWPWPITPLPRRTPATTSRPATAPPAHRPNG